MLVSRRDIWANHSVFDSLLDPNLPLPFQQRLDLTGVPGETAKISYRILSSEERKKQVPSEFGENGQPRLSLPGRH